MAGRKTRKLIVRWLVAAFLLTGTALIDAADQASRAPSPAPSAVQQLPTTADIPGPRLSANQRLMRDRFEALKRVGPRGIPPLARMQAIDAMRSLPAMPSLAAGTWSFIGPDAITNGQGNSTSVLCGLSPPRITVSGRVTAIAFGGEGIYLGSANGGLWKSTDGGASWTPLTDQQPSLAVGGLAVVPGRTHDTVYIGTGEGNNGCDNEFGQGVLKSTDGGATWSAPLGAAIFDRLTFAKLTVDPQNSDVLYAGTTFGFSSGAANECFTVTTGTSGVYKSTDAGINWSALAGGLPAGSTGNNFSGSAYDVAVDSVGTYSGPFTGIVKDTSSSPPCNPAASPGQATLTAVDPSNPGNPNPFTINVTPHIGGGFDFSGTLVLSQNPAPLSVPPGVCTDFRGTYDCADTEPDLRKTTGFIIQCFQRSGPFIEVDLVGNANPDGTLTGEWSSVAGVFLQDVVSNTPFTLKGGSNVYAGIGGPPGGLFRSTDSGKTWAKNTTVPAGRRLAMDITARGDALYTVVSQDGNKAFKGIFLSTDHGATFAAGATTLPSFSGGASCISENQGFYDLAVGVPPFNPQSVFLGMLGVYASSDFGKSFSYIGGGTHADQHAIKIDSAGNLLLGNDGGIFISPDTGKTWNSLNQGLGDIQFYAIGLDPSATTITGGTQDNGTNKHTGKLTWGHSNDGDGGYGVIDPANTSVYFAEAPAPPNAIFYRSKSAGALGSYSDISPPAASDPVQFIAPFVEDQSNPERVLFGTNRIWETCHKQAITGKFVCDGASSTFGPGWTAISGDLTGGCTGSFCDISDIAIAPTDPKVVYVVTSTDTAIGPLAWVTTNGTTLPATFTNITPPGITPRRPFTSIAVNPLDAAKVVITAGGFVPAGGGHVFLSTDMGANWTDISRNLTPDIPALSSVFDPNSPSTGLFVGTDIGMFYTPDLGATWMNANLGALPVVPVYQLQAGNGLVAAATHGRGVWTFRAAPSATPTASSSATPTATSSSTPTPTPTSTPTATPTPTGTPTETPTDTPTPTETPTPTDTPNPTDTPTESATETPAQTPTQAPTETPSVVPTPTTVIIPTETPTPGAGPFITKLPAVVPVGASFNIDGSGFTPGSRVNFFVKTASGAINAGPFTPTSAALPNQLTVDVPDTVSPGEGYVAVQVVNTDQAFAASNVASALLMGSAAAGFPSITTINGVGLAPTSIDPNFATDNVETVVPQGTVVTLGGAGFDTVHGVGIDLFCACPAGKVGPFFLTPASTTSIHFTVPSAGANAPRTGPGMFVVNNMGAVIKKSNGVSVPIGQKISVTVVSQSASKITVDGTGFSTLTVINFFNKQGAVVKNLGGLTAGGAAKVPLTFISENQFTFTVPAGAVPGPAYVQALNPPFVPFTSSGTGPGGAFTLH